MLSKDQILETLSHVDDPELHRSLTDLKMVRDVQVHGSEVEITIALTMATCPLKSRIEADVRSAVAALPGVRQVTVKMTSMTDEERKALFGAPKEGSAAQYNHIRRVAAVMSGKGGVGKSLVTGLLATALARDGYRVGVLDADITGPSIPMLFGLHGPVEPGPIGMRPLCSSSGVKVISMNLLLEREDQPIIWRGPMIGKVIMQLWGDVMWGSLDYLLVDLPPGTSDASLTVMQSLPVNGIIMVTTPQSLASMIVRKAVYMAQAVKTPIVGVVENMAYFICPDTGKPHAIFGASHSDEVTRAASAPLLTRLPIDPTIAALCDAGQVEKVELAEICELREAFTGITAMQIAKYMTDSRLFSATTRQLIESPENFGSLENPDARGWIRGWCGDSMQIDLRLAGKTIQEARFKTEGCEAAIACGSMITRLARARTLDEAQRITADDVMAALEWLHESHEHCADMAVNTLRQAIQHAIEVRGAGL